MTRDQLVTLAKRKRCPRCDLNKTVGAALCRSCRSKLPANIPQAYLNAGIIDTSRTYRPGILQPQKKGFMPRVGVAYEAHPGTVIRAGYGIYLENLNTNELQFTRYAAPLYFQQAFSNVLRNAVEACVDAETIPTIVVDGRVEGGAVRVTVDDNGPGIPVADRERVFRPFVTTKGRGTGLGLALVQKIIVTHNGRIQLASNPVGGASVQIVLPLPPL